MRRSSESIEGVAEGTAALLKYLSGRWADRVRRLLPLAVAGYAIAVFARPFLAIARAPWQVLVIRSFDRVGKGIRTSPRDKLLAASVPRERLAEAFAFHRGMDHAGAAIGPLLAAGLLLLWPEDVRRVFLIAAIPGTLAVLALFAVREPARESADVPRDATAGGRVPLPLLCAIALFTLGNSTDALLILRAQMLGVPTVQLPLLWALLHWCERSSPGPQAGPPTSWAGAAPCWRDGSGTASATADSRSPARRGTRGCCSAHMAWSRRSPRALSAP